MLHILSPGRNSCSDRSSWEKTPVEELWPLDLSSLFSPPQLPALGIATVVLYCGLWPAPSHCGMVDTKRRDSTWSNFQVRMASDNLTVQLWVKCLLEKFEDLSSSPQNPHTVECGSLHSPRIRWDKEIGESLETHGPASPVYTVVVNNNNNKTLSQTRS